ncbi:MAG: hypothetical protein JXX28_16955 [Deltaproteobacteria bacterium]|nr:hypothetical protein [Deltaproteobacteria bacterium]
MPRTAQLLDLALLLCLWGASLLVVRAGLYAASPGVMGPAVAVDLVLTALAVHWAVGLRIGGLPGWTAGPVLLVGVALTAALVPAQTGLVLALGALAELAAGVLALSRLRVLVREARVALAEGQPRGDAVERGLAAALESPRLASAVRLEVEVIGLALIGWFRRARVPGGAVAFTHHREAGWAVLAGALIALSLVEGGALHLFLADAGYPRAALVMTALHLYGVVWVLGDLQGLRLHPSLVDGSTLRLRVGLRWRAELHLIRVRAVERVSGDPTPEDLSLVVLGSPDVRLVLDRPVEVRGLFGLRRSGARLLLQLDDVAGFIAAVDPARHP